MLSDPLIGFANYTQPTFTGGLNSTTFRRVAFGRYIATDLGFSLDQPGRLVILPNVKPSGISTFVTRVEADYNLNPVNGVTQTDDTLRFEHKMSGNMRSLTAARARTLLDFHYHILSTNLDRILAGES